MGILSSGWILWIDGMGWGGMERKARKTDVPFMLCIRLERKRDEPNWTEARAISFPIQVVFDPGSSLGTWTWAARRSN